MRETSRAQDKKPADNNKLKTWLTAIFCVVRCILYPGTKICVASKNRNQANEVLEKITTILMPESANLRMEIKDFSVGLNKAFIEFHNNSHIKVVTAADSGRSARANILITDEFRMVDLTVINTVLRKFLTAPRSPKYLAKPEYKHLVERNKEIYMSSCWYKSHWSFDKLKAYCANLVNDTKRYFVCGLPYQLSIKEGLLSAEQVADEMSEADFSELAWTMEMECLWFGDDEGSLFTYDDISQNRKLKKAIYPSYIPIPKNMRTKIPDLAPSERRIMSVDVALLASKKHNNDAASIFINSALPNSGNKYVSNFIYTENHEGQRADDLALIVRRLFEEFHCTDLALDCSGIGIAILDGINKPIYDSANGKTYHALNVCNNKDLESRCTDSDARKVIWAINGSASLNSTMIVSLREGFRQGRVNLLISEIEATEEWKSIVSYEKLSAEVKIKLQLPFIHTTLLVNELISLDSKVDGRNIKVIEKGGMRKDRFSSVAMNYYVQTLLEKELNKPKSNMTMADFAKSISKLNRKPRTY